jgi:EpsI family protein
MGKISLKKISLLCIICLLAALFVYREPALVVSKKDKPLAQALIDIDGWHPTHFSILDEKVVATLKLDDYTNQNYSDGNGTVFLYVGYYMSAKKVGAAHDPLVCYPGQGWKLSGRKQGEYVLNDETGSVKYSAMIAQLEDRKELVVYWFQSYDQTNTGTFSQKVSLIIKKMAGYGSENAFVRVTSPIKDGSIEKTSKYIQTFVKAFYPKFLDFVKDGNSEKAL